MDSTTSDAAIIVPPTTHGTDGSTQTASDSLSQLLLNPVILERITHHLDTASRQNLSRTARAFQVLAWPYLPPLQLTTNQDPSQYIRTHGKKGRFVLAICISGEDIASEANQEASAKWVQRNRSFLTDDFRLVVEDTGLAQDPGAVLRLARGNQKTPSLSSPGSVEIRCRDGDLPYAFQRYAIAWTHSLNSANNTQVSDEGHLGDPPLQETETGRGRDVPEEKSQPEEPWLVFEGCLSDNGVPPTQTASHTRMPDPIRVPKMLWKLRPTAAGGLFDPMASTQDRRPGRLRWTVALLHSLAAVVIEEDGGQLIVTIAGSDDGLPANTAEGEDAMRDFSNLQAVYKHYCRSVTNDSSVIRFNADVTSEKYADRGIKPSESVEEHVDRLLRAVYFASSEEASQIEQNIRAQRPGFPLVSKATEPTEGSGEQRTVC